MRRVVPALCGVLLAVFPLLSLFEQNQSEVPLDVLWWPLALCVAGTVALFGIVFAITRHAEKAGVMASLVVVAFLYYGLIADQLSAGVWFVAPWLAVFVAGLVAAMRTRRDLDKLMVVIGVGAVVVALRPAISIVSYKANHRSVAASDPRLWPTALAKPTPPSGTRLPDIYVLIPDDYARTDVLRKYFHYDNTPFIHQLEQRGFVVSQQSRSPYSDSESNVAAAVNLDYLSRFPDVLGKRSEDVRPVKAVSEDNRASRLLRPLGYRYVHLDTDEVTFAGRNPDISALATPDSFANLWMQQSILREIGGALGFNQQSTDRRFRNAIHSVFAKLDALRTETTPKFVVFHTLLPHDPYIFGAQGEAVTFPGRSEEALASDVGRKYYLEQLKYVSRELLDAVDQIVSHATTPPVIVIQADEGFQANSEPFGEAAMLDIRVKGLSAFYLPGHRKGLPAPPNTVNALRFVFNKYLSTHYKMLRSASYPEGDLPYEFKEMVVK